MKFQRFIMKFHGHKHGQCIRDCADWLRHAVEERYRLIRQNFETDRFLETVGDEAAERTMMDEITRRRNPIFDTPNLREAGARINAEIKEDMDWISTRPFTKTMLVMDGRYSYWQGVLDVELTP